MAGAEPRHDLPAAGTGLVQAIESLVDVLGRALPSAQQRQLVVQLDAIELTLQVVACPTESRSSATEWRVLNSDDERHASVAHSLKMRLYSKADSRDSRNDSAERSLDVTEPAPRNVRAPEGRIVKATIYILRNRVEDDTESLAAEACLLVRQEVAAAHDKADISKLESIRAEHQDAHADSDRWESLEKAAADYFSQQSEREANISWWETTQSFPLWDAANVLNGAADWLRSLVDRPLTEEAQASGAAGPVTPMMAGITANAATERLTRPLEDGAQICEVAGIVIGLALGMHPMVIACGKLLARDEIGRALSLVYEEILDMEPIGRARERALVAEREGVQVTEQSVLSADTDLSSVGDSELYRAGRWERDFGVDWVLRRRNDPQKELEAEP
jgi:hypothetical protein